MKTRLKTRHPSWLSAFLIVALTLPLVLGAAPTTTAGQNGRGDNRGASVDDERRDQKRTEQTRRSSSGNDHQDGARRDHKGQEERDRAGSRDTDRDASGNERGSNQRRADERQRVESERRNKRNNKKRTRRVATAQTTIEPLRCEIEDDDDDENTPPSYDDGFCADQVVVQLQPGGSLDAVNARFGTRTIASVGTRNLHLLGLPANGTSEEGEEDEEDFAGRLQGDDNVAWAELNYTGQAPEGRPRHFFLRAEPTSGGSGDSYVPALIGIPAAHDCATGGGQTVAVVDSGIDAGHPAFGGRLANPWNAFTGDGREIADVGDNVDNDRDGATDEMVGHGTHVAGIVAQVAPGARILPIKALDSDGFGEAFYLARAIYHAVDRDVDVINLSLGSTEESRVVREAVEAATGRGIVVAAAAGNLGGQMLDFPAAYEQEVFAVAATDRQDVKADFSSYEAKVDLSAPGVGIVSAFPGGGYRSWDGTSMATPWVAGAAAVILSSGGNAADAEQRLRQTAGDLDRINPDYQGKLGAGRVDIGRAACA